MADAPTWSQTEDLQPSAHRAHRRWAPDGASRAKQVWVIEIYSEAQHERKVLHMGTVTLSGSWSDNGQITCSIS